MTEQLELNLLPEPPAETPVVRIRNAGVIRSNMDIDHLMNAVDRIGMKHHDSMPMIDAFGDFDEYGY
jgi:hypothetical protein